jgi:hypothetical protein
VDDNKNNINHYSLAGLPTFENKRLKNTFQWLVNTSQLKRVYSKLLAGGK